MTGGVTFETVAVPNAAPITIATLATAGGARLRVLDVGGIAWSLEIPDRAGAPVEQLLGYADVAQVLDDPFYIGALIGRVANRIRGAAFPLGGSLVRLEANHGAHHLHGGSDGFHRQRWRLTPVPQRDGAALDLAHDSPDGHGGYPGTVTVRVRYVLQDPGRWTITVHVASDRPTPVDPTHHAYVRLGGARALVGQRLAIAAAAYLPQDAEQLPTGEIRAVEATRFDLRAPTPLGPLLAQQWSHGGLDHTFVLDADAPTAARLDDPASGWSLAVTTSAPALHCYTANYLTSVPARDGATVGRHGAICLEAQGYPDAVHHPNFPSVLVAPDAPLHVTTTFAFTHAPIAG